MCKILKKNTRSTFEDYTRGFFLQIMHELCMLFTPLFITLLLHEH